MPCKLTSRIQSYFQTKGQDIRGTLLHRNTRTDYRNVTPEPKIEKQNLNTRHHLLKHYSFQKE